MYTSHQEWLSADVNFFWTKIARTDHVLQVYKTDGVFLDALTGFVLDGIHSDESVVVIASNPHLNALESRLTTYGLDIESLISDHKFMPQNADEALAEFLIDGMPDETLFKPAADKLFRDAQFQQRPVRLFGEATAILWHMGYKEGALKLEELWCDFHELHPHTLFCAYSEQMFDAEEMVSSLPICTLHSKMISGTEKQITRILYKQVA